MRIELDREEVLRAYACSDFVSSDQDDVSAWVHLQGTGQYRTWTASDGVRLLMLRGEPDSREFDVLLTPGQLAFLYAGAMNDQNVFLSIDEEGVVTVGSPLGNLQARMKVGTHPTQGFDVAKIEAGATGNFSSRDLAIFIDTQRITATRNESGQREADVGLVEGHLSVDLHSATLGYSSAVLAGRGVTGDVLLSVDLELLSQILTRFDPASEIFVSFPKYTGNPIVLRNEDTIACLMPLKTPELLAREHIEEIIESQYGHLALQRDSDGDYWLRRHGQLIYGRLRADSDPIALEVFGILLRDVEENPDLLKEINQINVSSPFIKISHIESQVVVSDELVAESLDAVELTNAVSKIAKALNDYSHTMSVVFGGVRDDDPVELRWNKYRDTLVQAEIQPERLEFLNGPEAILEWPFPDKVHVVSGWNPQGVAFNGEIVNSKIASDVMQRGGKFVLGAGVSSDGNYREPSLIIWGLTREDAQDIARRASQDAIFEITKGEISLISSYDNRIETFTRISGGSERGAPGYL